MRVMPDMAEAMTPFPHTIEAGESLSRAVQVMYTHNIRHLPVTDNGKLVGILTDRDAKLAAAVSGHTFEKTTLKVNEVCVFDPFVVEHTQRLDKVVAEMISKHIGSALVMRNGKLVGIFTAFDACKRLVEALKVIHPDA